MRKKIRENGNRSFEERKRNSKGPAEHVVAQLHIDRERRLGAKSARIPSVARIGPRATRLGEEREPIFIDEASVIEASSTCLPTHGPLRFGSNALESSPVAKTNHAGRALSTNPKLNFPAQACCAPRSPAFAASPLRRWPSPTTRRRRAEAFGVGGPHSVFPVAEMQTMKRAQTSSSMEEVAAERGRRRCARCR
jgi:hypothetical protein